MPSVTCRISHSQDEHLSGTEETLEVHVGSSCLRNDCKVPSCPWLSNLLARVPGMSLAAGT